MFICGYLCYYHVSVKGRIYEFKLTNLNTNSYFNCRISAKQIS